ncbi:FAD-dependent oxidoreductase [Gordonia terrae]
MSQEWDRAVDVLVAGSGIGGLGSAVLAQARGAEVEVVEKAATIGGTTAKSAAYMWVPNNRHLRESGRSDPREQALRYMAKLSRPHLYDENQETLGLPLWEYNGISSFYEHAAEAAETYERLGVVRFGHASDFPDYYSHLPENAAPTGRVLFPAESEGGPTGGTILINNLARRCEQVGIPITTGTRIEELILDESGAVTGAVVTDDDGPARVRAKLGVILATGGFTQDPSRRLRYLDHAYVGGCAAPTNTGDILDIVRAAGADFANMNIGMRAPMVLDRLRREPARVRGSFMIPGDSMLIVNRYGKRVLSEKTPYHDFARAFFHWDGQSGGYPNNPLIMIWDNAAMRFGGEGFGNPIPGGDDDPYWVVSAETLEELVRLLSVKLSDLGMYTGNAELDSSFGPSLEATIAQYNTYAESGVDNEFHRGATAIEQSLSAYFGVGDGKNPTMAPLSRSGPYHATVLGPALIDTAGGPRVTPRGRVLNMAGDPIEGLYAVGNCAATPSGEAYWAGGHTIGFIQCAAYLAAEDITADLPALSTNSPGPRSAAQRQPLNR